MKRINQKKKECIKCNKMWKLHTMYSTNIRVQIVREENELNFNSK